MKNENQQRSAESGRYVKSDFAKANKATTYSEANVTVGRAVKVLARALKKDKDFYFAWQSNITMFFVDATEAAIKKSETDIYTIANEAAKNFLTLLIRESRRRKN